MGRVSPQSNTRLSLKRTTMNHRIPILAFVALLLAGCASTDLEKVYQYRAVYTASVDTINAAHTAGLIDDATLLKTEPARKTALRVLGDAEIDARDADKKVKSWTIVKSAIASLREWVVLIERKK
jgi:PBP1b-binding outer membrane lipoprotein LpoB